MSSLTSVFGKANKFILKWPGLFGIPFYIFLFAGVAQAAALYPSAGLLEGYWKLLENIGSAAIGDSMTGLGIVFEDAAQFTANTAAPAMGQGLEYALS